MIGGIHVNTSWLNIYLLISSQSATKKLIMTLETTINKMPITNLTKFIVNQLLG